jgi:hypothetical protein
MGVEGGVEGGQDSQLEWVKEVDVLVGCQYQLLRFSFIFDVHET